MQAQIRASRRVSQARSGSMTAKCRTLSSVAALLASTKQRNRQMWMIVMKIKSIG